MVSGTAPAPALRRRRRSGVRRPSDQDRVRWTVSLASAAGVVPRAVEQRGSDVNGEPRPSDTEFERVSWSDRSDESTCQHPLGVAFDPAIAS